MQIIVAILIFPIGFVWISWLNAKGPTEAHLPTTWKAGVVNHGQYYSWPFGTVADNPIGFSVCSLVLLIGVGFLIYSSLRSKDVTVSSH